MDINTTSNVKGPSRDVAEDTLNEYQMRARRTPTLVGTKTTIGRRSFHKGASIQKGGPNVKNRYKLSKQLAEKKTTSNNKSTIINTTPEQDSAMIGTQ